MRILYASASFAAQYGLIGTAKNILEAWPKLSGAKDLLEFLKANPDPDRTALLDSGVFSTWTKGEEVDIDAYIQSCKTHFEAGTFSEAVNVDVIPGKWGEIPSAELVAASAEKGWGNYQYMIEHGLPPERIVHVFHQGEDFRWIKKLADYNDERVKAGHKGLYVGISPANDRTTKQRILWLEQVMPYITNKDGTAKMRWHGFGVTSFDIMRRYPWFTCDSTSWMRAGAMGQIKVPSFENPVRPYMTSKIQVALTKRSGMSASNLHFDSLAPKEQKNVKDYLTLIGVSFDEASADGNVGVKARQTANLFYWKRVEEELNTMDLRWKPMHPQFI